MDVVLERAENMCGNNNNNTENTAEFKTATFININTFNKKRNTNIEEQ